MLNLHPLSTTETLALELGLLVVSSTPLRALSQEGEGVVVPTVSRRNEQELARLVRGYSSTTKCTHTKCHPPRAL
eukprot:6213630-Pleurochrysis_carterae.AAC.3